MKQPRATLGAIVVRGPQLGITVPNDNVDVEEYVLSFPRSLRRAAYGARNPGLSLGMSGAAAIGAVAERPQPPTCGEDYWASICDDEVCEPLVRLSRDRASLPSVSPH